MTPHFRIGALQVRQVACSAIRRHFVFQDRARPLYPHLAVSCASNERLGASLWPSMCIYLLIGVIVVRDGIPMITVTSNSGVTFEGKLEAINNLNGIRFFRRERTFLHVPFDY